MKNLNLILSLIILIQFIRIGSTKVSYDLPEGWSRTGIYPENYLIGVDSTIFYGAPPGRSGFIKSRPDFKDIPYSFGNLIQNFFPKKFLGKRVQLTCFAKYNDVKDWAGQWMRVEMGSAFFLDNMFDRKINGTGDWKMFSNVLDVYKNATNLAFGALLSGEGEIWLDKCKFKIVDPNKVPTTNPPLPKKLDHPINLSF